MVGRDEEIGKYVVNKLSKYLLTYTLAALLLLVAAVVLAPYLIDPAAYKSEIAAFVKNKTGRDVAIEGEIKLSIVPWLGVNAEKITIGDRAGFQGKPFATIVNSEIKLKPLPLLKGKLEVSSLVLDGLTLHLSKDQDGNNNWDDLLAGQPTSPSATVSQAAKPVAPVPEHQAFAAFALGDFTLKNAHVIWENRQAGKTFNISNISLTSDQLMLGEPLKINFSADISGKPLAFPGHVQALTGLRIDQSGENLTFDKSRIEWSGKLSSAEQQVTAIMVVNSAGININKQTLTSSSLQLQSGELKLTADVTGENILDKPSLQGQVIVDPFNPGQALKDWGIKRPETSDAKTLTNAALKSQFHLTQDAAEFTGLEVTLDDSHGKGTLTINNVATPSINFDLAIEALNLDRYLPPRDKKEITTPGFALAAGGISLPLEWLKKLDAQGKLRCGKLTFNRMTLQDARLTLSANNGDVKLSQTAHPFYQGNYVSELTVDARAGQAQMMLTENMTNIDLQPYLTDVKGKAKLGGLLTTSAMLKGSGSNAKTLRSNVSGQVTFFLQDGFVQGFNLEKMINQAKNALKGGKFTSDETADQTAFKEIKGTVTINNGELNNTDLSASTASLRSKGKGSAKLATGQLAYTLTSHLLKAKATADSPEQVHNTPIVIHVGGTFNKPQFSLDVAVLLTDKNKAKLERLIDNNKDKIEKFIDKLDKKQGSGINKLLKKIF